MKEEDFIVGKPFTVNGLPYSHIEYNMQSDSLICFDELEVPHRVSVIKSKKDPTFTALLSVFGLVQCVTINLSCCSVLNNQYQTST